MNALNDGYVVDAETFRPSGARTSSVDDDSRITPPVYEHKRPPLRFCGTVDASSAGVPCVDGAESGDVVRMCADGSVALAPLMRRQVGPDLSVPGPWVQVDRGGCPEDPAVTVTLSAEEFRRLPLTSSVPSVQPADGQGLVNLDMILITDSDPQTLSTTVLDVPVTVIATPVRFTWTFGDGSEPLVTTEPGAPYPHQTVGYSYREPGAFAIQLTTAWSGRYQVDGAGPWIDVAGTAETVSEAFPVTIHEARTYLVDGTWG
ncbi:PKD domain-containing protein [Actinotalea sp. K2]|uniref:PKD domain-containing protein n=1 Tax=Actinotalea sp. K2 TaxID=2939438 RepID=UPI002017BD43|nr:hypothetical protein [Actinotalea sp. K2]MCL3860986.1 hypothetical protein [Actinotalea sp. K2]